MTAGSMFAASMCALAFFGNDDGIMQGDNSLSIDDMFNEL